jgi:hypothetical protein
MTERKELAESPQVRNRPAISKGDAAHRPIEKGDPKDRPFLWT